MDKFEFTLKNEKRKSYHTSLLVIILLNIVAFLFLAYAATEYKSGNRALFAAGFVTLSLLIDIFFKKRKDYNGRIAAVALIIYFYLRMHYYWPALGMIILAALYLISIRNLVVVFTDKEIRYPSFPKKKIYWQQLNNVMLKDALLTIDFKNNKLIQQYIEDKSADMNEKEFNDFCRHQITSNQ